MKNAYKLLLLLALGSGVFIISCKKYSKYTGGWDSKTYDCKNLKQDFGDACKTRDGRIGFVNKNCECEVKENKKDCPKLNLNYNDACKTRDGKVGFVNKNCECEAKENRKDCPKLGLNYKDPCKTKNGTRGFVNNNCECEGIR